MTVAYNPRPAKAPARKLEPWMTQEQIWTAWMHRVHRRGKPNTQRNLEMYTRPLFRMYPDDLVTTLNEDDMWNVVSAMERKCARLQNGEQPNCIRGHDIRQCPFITGAEPTTCPSYKPLEVQSVLSYLNSISQMYTWMAEQKRLDGPNPMLGVARDYKDRHRAQINELANDPNRRDLTLDEVRNLILGTPPNHAVVYFMGSKFFLRIHEGLRMSFDEKYCNLEEGWMIIPAGLPNEPHKRQGNHDVCLDREARNWLTTYRDTWWKANVARKADGSPITQRVALTVFGRPWGQNGEGNFNRAMQKHAERLGIMTGEEERGERVTTHAFRSFACTQARNKGCLQVDEWIMRGDKVPGPAGRYDNYRPRLPELYERYGPKLGL